MNDPSQTKAEPAGRPGLGRVLLMLGSVVLVLVLLVRLLLPQVFDTSRLVRFFRYLGLRDKESYGRISFEPSASNAYAGFDDGLLVGTESGLTLYDLEGEQQAFLQGSLPTPILRTGEKLALCFSPGGSYLAALGPGGEVLMDQTLSGSLVDADVSTDGSAAYISAESGYKSVATVCNSQMEPIYRFYSRTHYLNACALSEKGSLLALADLEEQDSVFRSAVILLRTDEPLTDLETASGSQIRAELGNQVIYELHFLDRSHLVAVGQKELCFLDTNGELLNSVSLVGQHLIDYSFSDEGWMLVALNPGGGGDYQLLTLDAQGNSLGEQSLSERVRAVSAAGDWAAVLTDSFLQTADRRLERVERSQDVLGALQLAAREDGTALLISTAGTRLYIP